MATNIERIPRHSLTIGHLPSSYKISLTYEEQLLELGKKTEEIINFINDVLEQQLNEYINARFNDMIINSMYDPATETLILYLDEESE
jgi:hypothetical protein